MQQTIFHDNLRFSYFSALERAEFENCKLRKPGCTEPDNNNREFHFPRRARNNQPRRTRGQLRNAITVARALTVIKSGKTVKLRSNENVILSFPPPLLFVIRRFPHQFNFFLFCRVKLVSETFTSRLTSPLTSEKHDQTRK